MNITIDPKYITYTTTVDARGKTTVKVSIDKTGLPENAKKVNISYLYLKNDSEETTPIEPEPEDPPIVDPDNPDDEDDVPQPTPGTITTVGETITIDENTEYPITGEFEIDGTPSSVDCSITRTEMTMMLEANEIQLISPPTISMFIEEIDNRIAFIGSKLN